MTTPGFPRTVFPALAIFLLAASSSDAVTISVVNATPNGTSSGGPGSGSGVLSTTLGSISSDRGLPVTTYSVTNVDLTSVGGGATESFTFSITYSQTGGTGVQFNSFGNVSVTGGDNNMIDGAEDLTVTIALESSSFAGLSLTGFTAIRVAALSSESATVTHGGGTFSATNSGIDYAISGTTFNLDPTLGTETFNLQRFLADFEAVPEPSALLLGGLGLLALLRRRR